MTSTEGSDAVVVAARALVARLHAIHKDDRYKSVWILHQARFGRYEGPNYAAELAALEAALMPPLVRGGQGRSDESVEGDAKVVLVWLVLAAAVSIALVIASCCGGGS